MARIYLVTEQYEKSIANWSDAIDMDQENPSYLNNRGQCYFMLADYKKALNDYMAASERAPDNTDYLNNIGASYVRLEEYNEGIRVLSEAISKDDLSYAYFWRGKAYFETKEYDKAVDDLEMYLRTDQIKVNFKEAQEILLHIKK